MVKNLLCRLFSRRNVKNSSEKQKIPHEDASLKKWQDFADRCDWKRVAEARAKFIPRAYEPYVQHDDEVWWILYRRLLQFELPVLTSSFIQENVERFIFVEDGASFSRIKDEVYHFHVAICSPRFVVEECGKLRGFALSGELVIVGVALAGTHPENVEKLIQGQGLQLLTREDSKCVEANLPTLIKMMKEVEVPSLEGMAEWMIAQPENQAADMYEIYDLRHPERIGHIEDDDTTCLLGKL